MSESLPTRAPAPALRAPLVVALPGDEAAADEIARLLGTARSPMETRRFPDGERYLRLPAEVDGRDAVIVGSPRPPDEGTLTLCFLADLLRDLGAPRVIAAMPYLPYMRQDIRFHPGEAVTSVSYARLLSRAIDGLVTVDPHLHRHRSLDEIYRVPSTVVPAAPAVARWIARHVPRPLIVGPDEESAQWAADVAGRLDAPVLVCTKLRSGDRDVRVSLPDPAAWRDRTPVIVDDILSSGRTLAVAVRALREAGLPGAWCVAVHGVFADDAGPLLAKEGAARVATCNTLPGTAADIDVRPDLALAVRAMLSHTT